MEELPGISKEEWEFWKNLKTTKEFVRALYLKRELLKEGLVESSYTKHEEELKVVGRCQALRDTIDYILHDFEVREEEIKEDAV